MPVSSILRGKQEPVKIMSKEGLQRMLRRSVDKSLAVREAARRVRTILGESNASDLAHAVACGDMDAVEKVVKRMQEEGLG